MGVEEAPVDSVAGRSVQEGVTEPSDGFFCSAVVNLDGALVVPSVIPCLPWSSGPSVNVFTVSTLGLPVIGVGRAVVGRVLLVRMVPHRSSSGDSADSTNSRVPTLTFIS